MSIPLIKREINLKKAIFQLFVKSKKYKEKIDWNTFIEAIKNYKFPNLPTIDDYMSK